MKKTRRFLSALLTAVFSVLFVVPCFAASGDIFCLLGLEFTYKELIAAAITTVVVVVALIIIIVMSRKKKGASIAESETVSEPVEAPKEDTKSEDVAEEAAEETEEAIEEEAKSEDVAEEATEEPEETVEEEAKSEDVAEEVAEETEEAVEKEAKSEDAAEVAEETEEAVEEVKEEAVAESVADEVTETAEVAQEDAPAATPAEAVDPETGCTYTFNEKGIPVPPEGMIIRYKWSFLGRLIQSDNVVKYRYMTLRRMLLAYAKVRSNVSWNYDSYFVGKKQIAKMKIRGKNLVVYFPIDPKTMEGTKYIGEDVSKVSRYKAVPFAYRINGNRKMKYAMELIAQLLEGVLTEAPEYNISVENANSAVPFEDFDTLYLKGYVKIGGFLAVTRAASANDDDDDEDEVAAPPQAAVEEEDDDTAALPVSTTPVEKEVFNFNPKKK